MALDGAFLYAVKNELQILVGSRVDKIHQPSKEEIIIAIRAKGGSFKLLISANADSARVHITKTAAENPKTPPMFCMLLRKHLNGGRLLDIRQDGIERILYFDFEAMNELGDMVKITLAAEIMGRYSNLIIINADNRIIDSIKRVDSGMSRERMVLPGISYNFPPREERLDFRDCTPEQVKKALDSLPDGELSRCLIKIFEGISPVVAREWVFYAGRGQELRKSDLNGNGGVFDRLMFYIKKSADELTASECNFTVIKERDGAFRDFSFMPVHQYGSLMVTEQTDSACGLLDYFYSRRDNILRLRQRSNDLYRLLINYTERISRRLQAQQEELAASAERGKFKLYGDLISANMYSMRKGMESVTLQNFYDEELASVKIPLDKRLNPSQNMQKYYSEYRKADTAEKILTEQIKQGNAELDYIDSVYDALTRAASEDEVNELRAELSEQGYIKSSKLSKSKPPKARPPLEFTSPDGFKILVGRNNKQNDTLTLKLAEKTDLWLHTKDITGSHVIVKSNGNTGLPDETVLYAAGIAALHSKAKNSSQVPVDYTLARYVKKPSGAKPGMVIFTNNKTCYVSPLITEVGE